MTQTPSSLVVAAVERVDDEHLVGYLRVLVYSLTALLGLSLLTVGTIAVIAQLKGTWHWMIHLESTVSYMGLFIAANLAVLVPAFLLFLGARRWSDA